MTKVLIHSENPNEQIETLARQHPDVTFIPFDSYHGLEDVLEKNKPEAAFSIRFGGATDFPVAALLGSSGPKWISVGGSGVDHLGRWDTGRVTVTNSAGVAAHMMAEYAIGSLLHFTLGIPEFQADKSNRVWRNRQVAPLRGKTLLVVGLGNTGRAVAALAKALGMTVIGTRARPEPTENVDHVHPAKHLPDLWGLADAIVVCAPLLDSTRGLLNAAAFDAMKPRVLLVDVSRGGIVVEKDLVAALQNGTIAGAALDVFELEPLPADSPLWAIENVIISPHCSSVHDGWEMQSVLLFSENLKRFLLGSPLLNVVDPDRGY